MDEIGAAVSGVSAALYQPPLFELVEEVGIAARSVQVAVASSICVSGPDSTSVLRTPQARGESPSGSKRSLASAWAAPAATTRSCPIRSVRFTLLPYSVVLIDCLLARLVVGETIGETD